MRTVAALALAALLLAPATRAAEPEPRRDAAEPAYESPILSLLLLPVNVLVRLASVFEPEPSAPAAPGGAEDARSR